MLRPPHKELILPTTITLTETQIKAVNILIDWTYNDLTDPDQLFYTLGGYAGTGKTTVVNTFIKNCKFVGSQIAVTAPTHKAVRVVSNITKINGKTIHSLLGLRPNVNLETFDINNPAYDTMGNQYIKNYSLIIIDECSQINDGLYSLILRNAKQYNTRILYVGDEGQTPPINEKISKTFAIKQRVILTQIVRQEIGNPLLELLGVIRADVINNTSKFIPYIYKHSTKVNEKEEGYAFVKRDIFNKGVERFFKHDKFTNDISYCRLAAYTNECLKLHNIAIRNTIFPENKNTLINFDDLMMAYSTIVDEFLCPIITNSDDYIVHESMPYTNEQGINGYLVRLYNVNDKTTSKYMFIVDTNDNENLRTFLRTHNKLLAEAINTKGVGRSTAFKKYYKFKDKNLLTTSLFRADGKLIVTKDIDYGYAATIHKL